MTDKLKGSKKPAIRRNTKTISFSTEEYEAIQKVSRSMGLYPRQAIIIKLGIR